MSEPSLDPTGAAELFLAGARDAGLRHICISPGSRSTPLAVAALRTKGVTTSVHLDERVGGFSALGRALVSGSPVGVICTSGTAGANYLPAISEAYMSQVPLLVITADRPPEHQSWGVGQTFEQVGLYHRQVRAEFTMPVGGDGGREHALRAGWRAATTTIEHSGPVHVNWPFRLPLEPVADALDVPPTFDTAVRQTPGAPSLERERLAQLLAEASAPILIAGPATIVQHGPLEERRERARQFTMAAEALGIPIISDILSGLRAASNNSVVLAPTLLLTGADPTELEVDLVLHVGQTPTAKSTRLWWEQQDATHVLFDQADTWNDPSHQADYRFIGDPTALLMSAQDSANSVEVRKQHVDRWVDAGRRTAKTCNTAINSAPDPSEPGIAVALGDHVSENDIVVASSSMPVRDLDMFAKTAIAASVFSNRGINGIDGVVATAAGIASHQQTHGTGTTFVLIGDVALLHDIGGVLDAARNSIPLTILVPNNDGGGIFSFLPAKQELDDETFSKLFHTPHGTSFEFLAGYPGISHTTTTNTAEALRLAETDTATVKIIELTVETDARIEFQSEVLAQLQTPNV